MPDIETSNIKITLAAARKNAGFTQAQVAEILHVSNKTIVNWEKGKVETSFATLDTLARLYKIPSNLICVPTKSA